MTAFEAVHCLPADAVNPLRIPCGRHNAAIGEKCSIWSTSADAAVETARRLGATGDVVAIAEEEVAA